MNELESWDPPGAFPPRARKRRTNRLVSKRVIEIPEEWRYLRHDRVSGLEENLPSARVKKHAAKRPRKFRNLNTGEVFEKQDDAGSHRRHQPIPPLSHKNRSLPENSLHNGLGIDACYPGPQAGLPVHGDYGTNRVQTHVPRQKGKILSGEMDGFGANGGMGSGKADLDAMKYFDGRFLHKRPDFDALVCLLEMGARKPPPNPVESSRPICQTGNVLANLRRPLKKKCMTKGIHACKRYKKARPAAEALDCSGVGEDTMNTLGDGELMHMISALQNLACAGPEERDEIIFLLSLLQESRFDAIKANEMGLDGILTQFQLSGNSTISDLAQSISHDLVAVLTS